MPTQCSAKEIDFGRAGGRRVVADFDGGMVSSDAGALLLGETDKAIRLIDRFAACFRDARQPATVFRQPSIHSTNFAPSIKSSTVSDERLLTTIRSTLADSIIDVGAFAASNSV